MADGDSSEQKPVKSEFDLEKTLKIISTLWLAVAAVIYSFTLGYFHRLEIPGSPSFFEAIRFYLLSALKNLYSSPVIILGLLSLAGSSFFGFKAFNSNSLCKKVISLTVALLLLSAPIYFLFKPISLFAPVILSLVVGSLCFIWIEDEKKSKSEKTLALVAYFIATILLSLWGFSTLDLSFFEKSKLNTYFPNGFGIKPYEPSNLIWSEDEKMYWYSCQETRGVIYGTKEENIFVRTEMSDSLRDHLCIGI